MGWSDELFVRSREVCVGGYFPNGETHYSDVIMGAIASQITSFTIAYSTVYSSPDQKKTPKLRVTGISEGNSPGTSEFPAQMASNGENVSIWWRHHGENERQNYTGGILSIRRHDSSCILMILTRYN